MAVLGVHAAGLLMKYARVGRVRWRVIGRCSWSASFHRLVTEVLDGTVELELPRTRRAPQLARQWLVQWLGQALDDHEFDDVRLLTTELVTNAVVHGCGGIKVLGHLDERRLMIEVIDEGKGFERIVRDRDFDDVGGLGLNAVDMIASRWGIHEGTSHVWFELERRGPRLGPANTPIS
jgi:anti-sigma regulatory factor (Ser/Thr protein kinase)